MCMGALSIIWCLVKFFLKRKSIESNPNTAKCREDRIRTKYRGPKRKKIERHNPIMKNKKQNYMNEGE